LTGIFACGGAVRESSPDDPPSTGGSTYVSPPAPPIAIGTGGSGSTIGPVVAAGTASTIGTAGTAPSGRGGASSIPIEEGGFGGTLVTGAAGEAAVMCTNPTFDQTSGLVSCKEGFVHRPVVLGCRGPSDRDELGSAGEWGAGGEGRLDWCIDDAECASSEICVCNVGSLGGTCVRADCRRDADCGEGLCASYTKRCGNMGFACVQPGDPGPHCGAL
jgi:hypothetical protein